ncbi:MAG: hypothetical protein QNJ47_18240 [Nostocaceae cyanobacterium]|nr:hypothetical protein [Nostocaceae cyanobacterium]
MLKNLISLGLATTVILGNLETVSQAQQKPISSRTENRITQVITKQNVPSVITDGFKALCSGKTKDAYNIWLSHAIPIVRDTISSTQVSESFGSMFEKMLGKCIEYSVIDSVSLTDKTQIIYFVSEHEKAAMFWQFTVYRSPDGWLISNFTSHTNPNEIIPPSVLERFSNRKF